MFPDYPTLICRRCANSFDVTNELQVESGVPGRIECPACKYETVGSGVQSFLKFYPRLLFSEKALAVEGIYLTAIGASDIIGSGHFSWLKEYMDFQCKGCAHKWTLKFDPNSLYFKQRPKTFFCPACFKLPPQKTTKEFFMCLNQTFESAFKFTHAQWDIFSPFGIPVPFKDIQSKIYSSKHPI